MSDGRADALERLLLERLERVASHPTGILRRALEIADLAKVPSDPIELALFCRGALDEALAEELGADAAEALVEELATLSGSLPAPASSVAERKTPEPGSVTASGARRRRPKERSGTRRRRDAFVVVASREPARAAAVIEALGEGAQAVVATDVFTLMQATESNLERELVLVIDGSVPGLRGPMLMTLSRILPPTSQVVFWGAPAPTGSVELEAATLPPEATPEEVAELCLGGPSGAGEGEPPLEVILIADDDPVWLTTVERRLRHEGYGVVSATDGFAALEAAIDHRPALVITDFDMPTLDGQQLAALIVGRFADAAPPIVMLTASEVGPVPNVARVMRKSAPFDELLAEVRVHLPEPAALERRTV